MGHRRRHVEVPGCGPEDRRSAAHRCAGEYGILLIDETTATVIHLDTSEILSTHRIDPERSYWRNTQKVPGRWPGTSQK